MNARHQSLRWTAGLLVAATISLPQAAMGVAATPEPDAAAVLKGGQEGTVFESLTVTGEDRIRIEFDRPKLALDLEPRSAPGLEWGDPQEVLHEIEIDFVGPLTDQSLAELSPFLPRPWIDRFQRGEVASFRPAVKDVARWKLTVADSRSETLRVFEGEGNPPKRIGWDGLSEAGEPVPPGITCSYVLEAYDRAGNRRNFVGQGFELSPYCHEGPDRSALLFSGRELPNLLRTGQPAAASPIVLEAVTWLNQEADAIIEVKVTARRFEEARSLSDALVNVLKPLVLGDPARMRPVTDVRPDSPDGGVVTITKTR